MSRILKFRAWSKKRKSYRELDQLVFDNKGLEEIWVFPKDTETQQVYHPSEMIIEQYTGLKDKNGKEIYEGDIVFCKQCNENHEIEWSDNAACFDSWQSDGTCCVWFGESHEKINYTVIGNIHENPELLGGEE